MTATESTSRSFAVSSVGGWLAILGVAIVFGPKEVYAEGSPLPTVNGLKLTVLPAAVIVAMRVTGYLAVATGLLLITVSACRRAAARRR